jgi:hypothetical protein
LGESGSRWARNAFPGDFAFVGEGLAPASLSEAARVKEEKSRERCGHMRPGY